MGFERHHMRIDDFDDGGALPRRQWQYSREYIDRLRSMVDAVGIIGQHVNLKPSGVGRWMGVCPFHNDHDPSLSVSAHGYRCFGCQAKGDVINFLMNHRGMAFGEVIRLLQQLTGMAPPDPLDAILGSWTELADSSAEEAEESTDDMMWKIASLCYGTLKRGWQIPIIYERVMTIFRVADEALANGDVDGIKDVIERLPGLLRWERISNEQGRPLGGAGGPA